MRKTKKERLEIAKKARATHSRNVKAKISYLQRQLERANWRINWIAAAYKSDNQEWIGVVKEDLAPSEFNNANYISDVLPYFNKRLRDSFFDEPKQYSFEWWLIETGKQAKRPDWSKVFA